MPTSSQPCRICHQCEGNQTFRVREMLHGTRQEYEYLECGSCGCLQLAEVPDDLSVFYPPDYCAYKDYRNRTRNVVRRVLDSLLVSASLPQDGITSRLLNMVRPSLEYLPWLQFVGIDKDSRILDVGCGNGKLLIQMWMAGFRNLKGVDPFIREDISVGKRLSIRRTGLREYVESRPGKYPLVMLHHAFEHVPNPVETLQDAGELLDDNGFLLIRIPVADCYSREHYGENWYNWDAPRHIYLHTMKSMQYVAEQTGFVIRKVEHDATYHQLRNSEMYLQGIPGNEHHHAVSSFTRQQTKNFKLLTEQLNREQRGEQAAFFLQKADSPGALRKAA